MVPRRPPLSDVAIAVARVRVAFNECIRRNRHGTGIALISEGVEVDADFALATADHRVGNSHVTAGVKSGAEVGMHRDTGSDEVDDGRRCRINWTA